MKLKVYTVDGSSCAEKDFAIPTLEEGKGVAALKQAIIAYQANQRQGSANSKNYGEVAGSGKKQGPQKGSGGARHGDKRAPQLSKGGVVFGPKPRDWSKALNAKVKKLAFVRALIDLAAEGGISVIEHLDTENKKTKAMNATLANVFPKGKILVIEKNWAENTAFAIRNIDRVFTTEAASVTAFDFVAFHQVLISEAALQDIIQRAQ